MVVEGGFGYAFGVGVDNPSFLREFQLLSLEMAVIFSFWSWGEALGWGFGVKCCRRGGGGQVGRIFRFGGAARGRGIGADPRCSRRKMSSADGMRDVGF